MKFLESLFFLIPDVFPCFCSPFVCTTCYQTTENIRKTSLKHPNWSAWFIMGLTFCHCKNHQFSPCSAVGCVSSPDKLLRAPGVPRKKLRFFTLSDGTQRRTSAAKAGLAGSWPPNERGCWRMFYFERLNDDICFCFGRKKKKPNWSCFAGEDEVDLRIENDMLYIYIIHTLA